MSEIKIELKKAIAINGDHHPIGTIISLPENYGREIIGYGKAVLYLDDGEEPKPKPKAKAKSKK